MQHSDWRESVLSDVLFVAQHLRYADRQEIAAVSGEDPEAALLRAFITSELCGTIVDPSGVPVGLFGVVLGEDRLVGTCWAVMTDHIRDIRFDFLRRCQEVINRLNREWPILHNFVDQRNALHLRWLQRMGFVFLRVIPGFGAERRPFIEFVRIRNV